jgi:hypothetical protein
MVEQECTRCGFRTQTSLCENCGSAALDVVAPAPSVRDEPVAAGAVVALLNAAGVRNRWDHVAQPLRENPALP